MKTSSICQFYPCLALAICLCACHNKNEVLIPPTGKIVLQLSVNDSLTVVQRSQVSVNPDSFSITVFNSAGTNIKSFDKYSDIPGDIELDTGSYYIQAESPHEYSAAFDQPFFSGTSERFQVNKSQEQTISIICRVNNFEVNIDYEDYIKNNFDDWRTLIYNSIDTLIFIKNETRSGYFKVGNMNILSLLYINGMENPNDTITIAGTITNPESATKYNITVHTPFNLSQDLNAYFPFNGSANDTAQGYLGTVQGATVYTNGADGSSQGSFHFAHNEIINTASSLVDLNNDYTMAFWFNMDSLNQTDHMQYILSNRIDQNFQEAGGMDFNFHDNLLHVEFFRLSPLGIIDQFITNHAVSLNAWHFIVFKKSGSNAYLYIDNQLTDAFNTNGHIYDNSNYWSFGAIENSTEIFRGLRGSLDQVRFYQRSLSASEIKYLYYKKS